SVDEGDAVKPMQPVTVRDRTTSAPFLVTDGGGVIGGAVEERHAQAVRCIHEPGIGIGQRIEVLPVATLEAEAEVLSLAEEVARGELGLHEEAGALGVAAAELHVVPPLFA